MIIFDKQSGQEHNLILNFTLIIIVGQSFTCMAKDVHVLHVQCITQCQNVPSYVDCIDQVYVLLYSVSMYECMWVESTTNL